MMIIIGMGITGLSNAVALARKGHDVVLCGHTRNEVVRFNTNELGQIKLLIGEATLNRLFRDNVIKEINNHRDPSFYVVQIKELENIFETEIRKLPTTPSVLLQFNCDSDH